MAQVGVTDLSCVQLGCLHLICVQLIMAVLP